MSKHRRRWMAGAFVIGVAASGAWLLLHDSGEEAASKAQPELPTSRARTAADEPSAKGPSRPTRKRLSPDGPASTAVLASLHSDASSDEDAPPLPAWKRPMKPASDDWTKDPRLVEQNEKVKAQLAETEDWFEQQPATAEWQEEGSKRMERVKTHAARLGQRVVRGECRVGVCRLEVERDPSSKRHVRMRPLPRVIHHPDGSKMVRFIKDGSLRTIFYLVDE